MNPLVLVAIVALLLFTRKPKVAPVGSGSGSGPGSAAGPADGMEGITRGLVRVFHEFGEAVARNVERIYRLETAGFTSGQYERAADIIPIRFVPQDMPVVVERFEATGTPGMHANGSTFPFGWTSLRGAGFNAGDFNPVVTMSENAGGGPIQWVAFKRNEDAAYFMGYFLNKYGNRPGRWRADDAHPEVQATYAAMVAPMPTPIVDDIAAGRA